MRAESVNWVKRTAFRVVSGLAVAVYRRFPIFGRLHGAVLVVRKADRFLVVERNDGTGLCFPGGRSSRNESLEATLRREIHEETGLRVTSCGFLFEFNQDSPYLQSTSVFEGSVEGQMRASWEGTPRWATVEEIERLVMPAHRPIVEYLSSEALRLKRHRA